VLRPTKSYTKTVTRQVIILLEDICLLHILHWKKGPPHGTTKEKLPFFSEQAGLSCTDHYAKSNN
jgi:hypothetical protein